MQIDFERRCWAEIDLDKLSDNFAAVRAVTPKAQIMAVVKANAYGHDDIVASRIFSAAGADRFAVSGLLEAVRLRRAEIQQPILVLGHTSPLHVGDLGENGIEQCVYSLEYARQLSAAATAADIRVLAHFKVDTGMGRLGFPARDDTEGALAQLAAAYDLPGLVPVGIFTHFAAADSAAEDDIAYTKAQYALFCAVREALAGMGKTFPYAHCCNSAATIAFPEMHMDIVRPGIILYGLNPSADIALPGLRPAFCMRTVITMIKQVQKGDALSYNRTFTAPGPMRVATLSTGYADGYPRLLSGTGIVDIAGQPAPVLGRVCMDQLIVDISHIEGVQLGDTATLIGGEHGDSLETAAAKCGTVHYEILCNIGRRVQRVYTESGEEISLFDYTYLSKSELRRYRNVYWRE